MANKLYIILLAGALGIGKGELESCQLGMLLCYIHGSTHRVPRFVSKPWEHNKVIDFAHWRYWFPGNDRSSHGRSNTMLCCCIAAPVNGMIVWLLGSTGDGNNMEKKEKEPTSGYVDIWKLCREIVREKNCYRYRAATLTCESEKNDLGLCEKSFLIECIWKRKVTIPVSVVKPYRLNVRERVYTYINHTSNQKEKNSCRNS